MIGYVILGSLKVALEALAPVICAATESRNDHALT